MRPAQEWRRFQGPGEVFVVIWRAGSLFRLSDKAGLRLIGWQNVLSTGVPVFGFSWYLPAPDFSSDACHAIGNGCD